MADPIKVFFSYSHKDEVLRNELDAHLSPLRQSGLISTWWDEKIVPGDELDSDILAELDDANIILLLVSADFIASKYCYCVEMERAVKRHEARTARVIPVILRDVAGWQKLPFGKLKAMPKDGKAVTSWQNRDEALADVASGVWVAVEDLNNRPSAASGKSTNDGKPTVLPPIWNVPHQRNPNFTGRESLLDGVRKALTSKGTAALTRPAEVCGLGGVGKTQTAVEYAYRYASDYRVVWWVRSEEPATLASDYAKLAAKLTLPEEDEPDQRVVVDAVKDWLRLNGGWLLVFDNAPDMASVRDYLPQGNLGHMLITSRDPNWGAMANPISVDEFEQSESVEFLLKRTGQEDREAASALAENLGHFPLALEQGAAYVEETKISIAGYVDLFRKHHMKLLERSKPSTEYPATVATTWEMSFDQVNKAMPEAKDLLNLCAFLAPDDIPKYIFIEAADNKSDTPSEPFIDELRFEDMIRTLRRYSLIEVDDKSLSMHRLVQEVVRDRLADEDKAEWASIAVKLVDAFFANNDGDFRSWSAYAALLPHVLAATEQAEKLEVEPEVAARILNNAAGYLWERPDFGEAQGLLERALAIKEKVYGPEHQEVATDLNNLGNVLHALWDLEGAKKHHERALAIKEKVYGIDHPEVATSLNNLGNVLRALWDLRGAKRHYERALAIRENVYGPNHPDVATTLNNLGVVLKDLGDLKGARMLAERALGIYRARLGEEHPETVRTREWLEWLDG